MGKVEDALSRLDAAVTRLERMVHAAGAPRRPAVAQADYAALAEVTDSVARRLDAVIGRLDRALEG
ncbi:MAG TPA: hypothetical protein VFA22_02395 [Stellaceae bacterium]|nr:hypothetical protein [Stellaceae bacterium]